MTTKLSFRLFALCLCVCVAGAGAIKADEPQKTTRCVLKLDPEIDCPSCEDRLKAILVAARGVQSAEIDVLTNRIALRYDPARVSVKALIGRIAVTGYTASEVK